jgi:hypothetical protein
MGGTFRAAALGLATLLMAALFLAGLVLTQLLGWLRPGGQPKKGGSQRDD